MPPPARSTGVRSGCRWTNAIRQFPSISTASTSWRPNTTICCTIAATPSARPCCVLRTPTGRGRESATTVTGGGRLPAASASRKARQALWRRRPAARLQLRRRRGGRHVAGRVPSAMLGTGIQPGPRKALFLREFTAVLQASCDFEVRCCPSLATSKIIDIGDYYGDYSALRDAAGWEPRIGLEEGLRRTIAFYREHRVDYWDDAMDLPTNPTYLATAAPSRATSRPVCPLGDSLPASPLANDAS